MDLAACNEPAMIVQEAYDSFILAGELEVRLPKVVAALSLEPAHTLVTSRLCNGPNQSSLNHHPVDDSMAYGCSSFIILPQVALNLAWSPMLLSPKLRKWIHSDLGSRMYNASGMRLCCQIFRPIFTKDAPPPVNSLLTHTQRFGNIRDLPTLKPPANNPTSSTQHTIRDQSSHSKLQR